MDLPERLAAKAVIKHLLSHWPAHLVWVWPVIAFLVPSLHAYEAAHHGAEVSQAIGIFLSVAARYITPAAGASQ
jgi:hypothetical protein